MILVTGPTYRHARQVEKRLKADGYDVRARSLDCPEHFMGFGRDVVIVVACREILSSSQRVTLGNLSKRLGHTIVNYEEPRP